MTRTFEEWDTKHDANASREQLVAERDAHAQAHMDAESRADRLEQLLRTAYPFIDERAIRFATGTYIKNEVRDLLLELDHDD